MLDPFTMEPELCDADGIVRRGSMHHGTDYPCTGSAHFDGEHVRCTNPIHNFVPFPLACGHVIRGMAHFEVEPGQSTLVECPDGCSWQSFVVEPSTST